MMQQKKKRTEQQINSALQQSKASLEIEGLHVTEAENALAAALLKGEISEEEFVRRALELAKNE